jgi:peptidoglycan/LPS O-acetylase OafA/YrhL
MADITRRSAEGRFVFIDAMRGLAALAVVVEHVYGKNLTHARALPEPFHAVFVNGYLGVFVFFALSGFVISHAVGNTPVTLGYLGRFALRRAVRLDPPYWATIALAIGVVAVSNVLFVDRVLPLPTPSSVVTHLFYLQALTGHDHILGVFWTLCYEVQFYLLYVVCLGVGQKLARSPRSTVPWTAVVLVVTGVLGLGVEAGVLPLSSAWCLGAWPCFLLGVAARAVVVRRLPFVVLAAVVIGLFATLWACGADAKGIVTTGATALVLAGLGPRLAQWSLGRPLQALGAISYSLYLTHMIAGSRIARGAMRVFGAGMTTTQLVLSLVLAVAGSIAFAAIWYLSVERPAQQLSRRVRLHA